MCVYIHINVHIVLIGGSGFLFTSRRRCETHCLLILLPSTHSTRKCLSVRLGWVGFYVGSTYLTAPPAPPARARASRAQTLRLLESRDLLQFTAAECLEQKKFPLAYRVFRRGIDCSCECDPQPPAELEAYARDHAKKPKVEAGTVVCVACHEVDVAGVHDPEAM